MIGHLIELKPQQAGDYVLLLNTYAAVGDLEQGSRSQEVDAGKRNTNYTWLHNCGV